MRTRSAKALRDVRSIGALEPVDPPVNRVLPVSRSALAALWAALGED